MSVQLQTGRLQNHVASHLREHPKDHNLVIFCIQKQHSRVLPGGGWGWEESLECKRGSDLKENLIFKHLVTLLLESDCVQRKTSMSYQHHCILCRIL